MSLNFRQEIAIRKIRKIIDAVPERRLPIKQLLDQTDLSEDKLTTGFKELFGITLYQHQIKVAMDYALILLQKGEKVKTVATILGYSSAQGFAKAFYNVFNAYPTAHADKTLRMQFSENGHEIRENDAIDFLEKKKR